MRDFSYSHCSRSAHGGRLERAQRLQLRCGADRAVEPRVPRRALRSPVSPIGSLAAPCCATQTVVCSSQCGKQTSGPVHAQVNTGHDAPRSVWICPTAHCTVKEGLASLIRACCSILVTKQLRPTKQTPEAQIWHPEPFVVAVWYGQPGPDVPVPTLSPLWTLSPPPLYCIFFWQSTKSLA